MKNSLTKKKAVIRYLERFKLLKPPFDCPSCPVSKRNYNIDFDYVPDCDMRFETIFNTLDEEIPNCYKESCETLVEELIKLYYKYKNVHFTVIKNE